MAENFGTTLTIVPYVFKKTGAGNGETLETFNKGKGYGVVLYDCGGASRTGVILQKGRVDGQTVVVTNVSDAAETITFAAAATSFVASGTSMVIARYESVTFVWSKTLGVWQGALGGGTAVADGAITLAKLDTGITPSHVVKYAGTITWSGSGATKATTVTGVAATDIVVATIKTKPTQAAYIVAVTPTLNTITIELSAANTSNDAVIAYSVLRAAA